MQKSMPVPPPAHEKTSRNPIASAMNSPRWASPSRIPRTAPPGRSRDDKTRYAVSKTLALLHLHQVGGDRCCDFARPETASRGVLDAMGQALPKPALRPFLAV